MEKSQWQRGVFHHNNTEFFIHPLPHRFGNRSHIILESEREVFDSAWKNSTVLDKNIQFEPDQEEFRELKLGLNQNKDADTMRTTRNIENDRLFNAQQHQLALNLRFKPRHHRNHHKHHLPSYHHFKRAEETQHHRSKRYIHTQAAGIPDILYIETAIFVDIDLYKHMAKNFPKNTSSHLIRFVLAMINGVQLLYHHPSLGKRVNFVLKRLEILEKDPPELRRSSDIDIYLSNFCKWQNDLNPSEHTGLKFDHAVILTGERARVFICI